MIFGCAFFFGMLFRTVITFSLIGTAHDDHLSSTSRLLEESSTNQSNANDSQTANQTILESPPNFIDYFEMNDLEEHNRPKDVLVFIYYSFTTLSTVGFGDFHPRSNTERIFVAFFMLFGVMIFSYIMGVFIDMLNNF